MTISYANTKELIDKIIENQTKTKQFCQSISESKTRLGNLFIYSPSVIANILQCINDSTDFIDTFFNISINEQEQFSYIVVNYCNILNEIGEPLFRLGYGEKLYKLFIYGSMAMSSIINLSTVRYIRLRMRLLITSFHYLIITANYLQATNLLKYITKQIQEFRAREEVDLPVPIKVMIVILECEADLSILKLILAFYKLPNSIDIMGSSLSTQYEWPNYQKYNDLPQDIIDSFITKPLVVRFFIECCRLQQLALSEMLTYNNESWQELSIAIVKVFLKFIQDDKSSKLSFDCLSLILFLTLCIPLESFKNTQQQVFDIISRNYLNNISIDENDDVDVIEAMLVKHVYDTISLPSSERLNLELLLPLVDRINQVLASQARVNSFQKPIFLQKLMTLLFQDYLKPRLQHVLDEVVTNDSSSTSTLFPIDMQRLLVLISRIALETCLSDCLLLSSIIIITSSILHHVGDYRNAISFTKRTLDYIDDFRASRVDLNYLLPLNSNLPYIQRLSFSLTNKTLDSIWYDTNNINITYETNQLQVYGGNANQLELIKYDDLISNFHCDLLALYFQLELEYAISQCNRKYEMKYYQSQQDRLKLSNLQVKAILKSKEKDIILAKQLKSLNEIPTCLASLESYCGSNLYMKAIMYMSMARIESQVNIHIHSKDIIEYIQRSRKCILDVEMKEKQLIDKFQLAKANEYNYPLILSRSHRTIYIRPNIHLKTLDQSYHYQILAKEYGSGTNVVLTSNRLQGCELKLSHNDILKSQSNDNSWIASCIPITSLKPNERYVFGTLAIKAMNTCNESSKSAHTISETTIDIEACNPLPTLVLYSKLCQILSSCCLVNENEVMKNLLRECIDKVLNQFFVSHKYTSSSSICLANGMNIHPQDQPNVLIFPINQSTRYSLVQVIIIYLLHMESQYHYPKTHKKYLFFNSIKSQQKELLGHLQRTINVMLIACHVNVYDMILQLLILCHQLISDLLSLREEDMLAYLFPSLIQIIQCLHIIEMKYWDEAMLSLYCHVLYRFIQSSIQCHQWSLLISTLDSFIQVTTSIKTWHKSNSYISISLFEEYKAFIEFLDETSSHLIHNKSLQEIIQKTKLMILQLFYPIDCPKLLEDKSKALVGSSKQPLVVIESNDVKMYLWTLPSCIQYFLIKACLDQGFLEVILGMKLITTLNTNCQQLEKWIRTPPLKASSYLQVLDICISSLTRIQSETLITQLVHIFTFFPIKKKLLCQQVKEEIDFWKVPFIDVLVIDQSNTKSNVKSNAKPNSKKNDIALDVLEVEDISKYDIVDEEEIMNQWKVLNSITNHVRCLCVNKTILSQRPDVVNSKDGPYQKIDAKDLNIQEFVIEYSNRLKSKSNIITANMESSVSSKPLNDSIQQYIHLLLMNICWNITSKQYLLACNNLLQLWEYIINQWLSPLDFIQIHSELKLYFVRLMNQVIQLVQDLIDIILTKKVGLGLEQGLGLQRSDTFFMEQRTGNNTFFMEQRSDTFFMGLLLQIKDILWYLIIINILNLQLNESFHCIVLLFQSIFHLLSNFPKNVGKDIELVYNMFQLFIDILDPLVDIIYHQGIVYCIHQVIDEAKQVMNNHVIEYEKYVNLLLTSFYLLS